MGILDFFRTPKAVIPASDANDSALVERALARAGEISGQALTATMMSSQSQLGPRKGSSQILSLYRESPWLRGVGHHVSSTVAAVQWKLYAEPTPETRGAPRQRFQTPSRNLIEAPLAVRSRLKARALAAGDLVEISRHPWCDLMARPNPMMHGKVARQVTIASYDLVGDAGWVLDRSGPENVPVRFWPVPGTWMQQRPTAEDPVWQINVGGIVWRVPLEDFLSFTDPDPSNPYGPGAGLGLALADELDIDENAGKTVAAWFQNRAMPDAIISMKGARPEVVRRAKTEWNNLIQGFRKAYKTHFVNTEVSVQRMDTTFKDQSLLEIRKSVRDTLQQVWGVPPEKLGIVTNSNRATAQAARAIDAEDVQVPRLEMMREELQRLAWMFDSRLIVDYENPIPDDVEAMRAVFQAFPGRFSIDEERSLAGREPLADGSGSGFLVNGIWVPNLRALAPDIRQDHIAAGIVTTDEVRQRLRLPPQSTQGGDASKPAAPTSAGPQTAEDLLMNSARSPTALAEVEIQRIVRRVDVKSMFVAMAPVIGSLIGEWGQAALETVIEVADGARSDEVFDVGSGHVKNHMQRFSTDRIHGMINATTRSDLADLLSEASRKSLTGEEIKQNVRSFFDASRIERSNVIAESESIYHSQFAAVEAFKQSGIPMQKEWIATLDGRTRDEHMEMDGQRQDLTAPFKVPSGRWAGATTQQPGGFRIPSLDINCRCVVGTVIADSELAAKLLKRAFTGIAVFGPLVSQEERAAAWSRADETLKPWDDALSDAVRIGFDTQEASVLSELAELVG